MKQSKHTPAPWNVGQYLGQPSAWFVHMDAGDKGRGIDVVEAVCGISPEQRLANARLIAAAPELLEALQSYASAEAMTNYGDSSDFVWPKIEMRRPGETAWGWICEKHGLGYQSGCICCRNEFVRHGERKDREARYTRDEALRAARDKARAVIAKATGT